MATNLTSFEKAMELASSFDENFLELGRQLRDMLETSPDEFQKFIDKSKIGKRKAYYLVAIDKAFRKLAVSKARLQRIGWTKLMVLAKHNVDEKNAQKFIALAEAYNTRDLEKLLNDEKPTPNAHCVLLYFDDADYAALEKALVKHGAGRSSRGLTNKEEALIKIIKKGQ